MICLATFDDIPEIVALVNSVYRAGPDYAGWTTESHLLQGDRITPGQLREIIHKPDHYILIRKDETGLVGTVHLEKSGTECYLGMFSVRAHKQNQGLGRQMMDMAATFARENLGCTRMRMYVIHQRPELVDYYKRRGYHLTGETQPFASKGPSESLTSESVYFDVMMKDL